MNTVYTTVYHSPVGELILGSFNDMLCLCDWRYRKMRAAIDKRICIGLDAVYVEKETPETIAARKQLDDYFAGSRKDFDIQVLTVGTDFQKYVWEELQQVPYGKTETYAGLAKRLGNDSAVRAVASANGANAISIIVPCHRIIGSDGELTGYAGGLPAKKKLLLLEGSYTIGHVPFVKGE